MNVGGTSGSLDPKAAVTKFAEIAQLLEPEIVMDWGLLSLQNEFGEETLASKKMFFTFTGDNLIMRERNHRITKIVLKTLKPRPIQRSRCPNP